MTAPVAARMPSLTATQRVAVIAATLARVTLGALWLNEGLIKLHAGFGKADILLIVNGATGNSRSPGAFGWFATHVLGAAPALFAVGVEIIEVGLGVALILGILTLPAAVLSVVQLAVYWTSDQLVAQYPVMVVLSAIALLAPVASTRYGLRTVVLAFIERRWHRPVPAVVARIL